MSDQQNDSQKEVTLEELLRVKRSEKPDQAFWGQFDRELHQRMLQTLVKKDPWYVQIMRGLRGRIVQTATVGGLAALLLLTFGRAFISTASNVDQIATTEEAVGPVVAESATARLVEPELNRRVEPILPAVLAAVEETARDYQMVAINGKQVADAGFKREFGMDSLQVASYDSDAYSGDLATTSLSFVNTGVASLVY